MLSNLRYFLLYRWANPQTYEHTADREMERKLHVWVWPVHSAAGIGVSLGTIHAGYRRETRLRTIFPKVIDFWWGLIHRPQGKSCQCKKGVKRLNRILQWGPKVVRARSMKTKPLRGWALEWGLREVVDSPSLEIFKTYPDDTLSNPI